MKSKRWICCLLVLALLLCLPISGSAAEDPGTMGYNDYNLEKEDNYFTQSIHTTIGRGNPGSNSYCAQSFIATVDYVTGCRLHFRLGDNATMTIQIRTELDGGPETILYTANYPLVSDPHNITDWWDFDFTRPVKLTQGEVYYLMFWCDIYHSYCIASSTQYVVYNTAIPAYRKPENGDQWLQLNARCYGFEMLSDPNADVQGIPYAMDDNTMMLHHAEEYYGFNRTGDNTDLLMNGTYYTQGYFSMQLTGRLKDSDGAVFSAYVDFDEATDLTPYSLLYLDLFVDRKVTQDLTLSASLLDRSGANGLTFTSDLKGLEKGWHRLILPFDEATAVGSGSLTAATQLALRGMGAKFQTNLTLCFDNLRVAKETIPTFTSGYYTDEQLAVPSVDGTADDVSYIGKPDAEQPFGDVMYGDVDGNERIDTSDALYVLKCSVNKIAPTAQAVKAGDVSGDNQLTASDALYILQYAVGKITRFPVTDIPDEPDPPAATEDFHVTTEGLAENTVYHIRTDVIAQGKYMLHDKARLASSLQGLINRDIAQNHVALVIDDAYASTWVSYIQENDPLLDGMDERVDLHSFDELLTVFTPQLLQCGMILWDPNTPSTANVAATICGLDGYLPVKYDPAEDTLYTKLVELGVPVKQNLVGLFTGKGLIPGTSLLSTGSKKCDPYLWALEKYVSRCSEHYLMYVPDGSSATVGNRIYEEDVHSKSVDYNKLFNHDYGIYRKAFFFDLTPIDIEAPCDDPTQPLGTDLATLRQILLARYYRANGEFGEVVGFPPWALKYATHNGWGSVEATSVEAAFTAVITEYNCYMDADGSIANCSLYTQFALEDHYEATANHKPVTEEFDDTTMYLYMYTGDYDSSPWVISHLYRCYRDQARGSIPITWSFTPSLSDRIPMVFDYLYKNQTENDYFSAADSGVGYIRPQGLFQSESDRTLPDGDREFIRVNKEYFSKFDLDSVGFIIGKLSDKVCRTYNQFAPIGSGSNDNSQVYANYAGTPYTWIKNGIGNPATTEDAMNQTVADMYAFAQDRRAYHGAGYRTITFTAGELKRTQEAFIAYASGKDPETTYKFVDYKTFFAMLNASAAGRCIPD